MLPVYLAPSKFDAGLVTLTGPGLEGLTKDQKQAQANFALRDLASLFEEDEDTDAHVVAYGVRGPDGKLLDRIPRLNKDGLNQVLAAGFRVEAATVWLDLDLKHLLGKDVRWADLDEAETDAVHERINRADEILRKAGMPWSASYTSGGGLRFIHALATPVPIGPGYEALIRRFFTAYDLAGLPVDQACKDWTRLYRAPRVVRDDEATASTDWFGYELRLDDDETYYAPKPEDLVAPKPVSVAITHTKSARPDPDEARALIEVLNQDGKWVQTVLGKKAKAALKSSWVYDTIYNKIPIAKRGEGKTHDALTRTVGETVSVISDMEGGTPELVYALLWDATAALGEDEDWLGKLWEMTSSFWDRDQLRKAEQAAAIAEKLKEQETVNDNERARFLRGVREWIGVELPDAELIEYLKANRYGIAMDARKDRYHVLLPTGYYDEHPCSSFALAKVIEQRGMQWLVPTEEAITDKAGNTTWAPIRPDRIVQRHARAYTQEEIRLDRRASYLRTDRLGRDTFVEVPFALRDDIPAERSAVIEEMWLAAAGGDRARRDEMLVAIGSLLLFQYGPTAAVLLHGEANAGKSMLSASLAECFTTRTLADGAALVDNFNDALRRSPLIHIEETADAGSKGIDPAGAMRRIVTAPRVRIEQKGRDSVDMQGVHRILITANSKDCIKKLMGSSARSGSDWRAIGERLAEFPLDVRVSEWFTKNNQGWRLTRKWIGDQNRVGEYAKFWFWVIKHMIPWENNRPVMRGRRLLYEGNCASLTVRAMEASANGVPEIACAINRLLGMSISSHKPRVVLERGKVYLTPQAVIDDALDKGGVAARYLREALEALLDPESGARFYVKGHQARWRSVDARKMLDIIEQHAVPDKAWRELEIQKMKEPKEP